MSYSFAMTKVDVQIEATVQDDIPAMDTIREWVQQVLYHEARKQAELVVRIVDAEEMQQLNNQFRHQDKVTNVLSFAVDDEFVPQEILGDIVICAPVVREEARQQGKSTQAHYAHMVVHGVLHLLGYDHIDDAQARQMESLEIQLLDGFGFASPYAL